MIIEIARLDREEQEFEGEEPAEALDLADAEEIRPAGPLRYSLKASFVDDNLIVQGVVKADVTFLCARCADAFRQTVCDPEFLRVVESPKKGESVDLTQDIRESIILAFPTTPLCDPDCKGLCPLCGTNLNKGTCRCERSSADSRWNVLGNMQLRQQRK